MLFLSSYIINFSWGGAYDWGYSVGRGTQKHSSGMKAQSGEGHRVLGGGVQRVGRDHKE